MKKALLLCAIFLAVSASSISVPKKVIGRYHAEIPDFEFVENGETKRAAGFKLSIILREHDLMYRAGSLELKGKYTAVNQNGGLIDMKVNLTNSSSINFDLDLVFDKKSNTLAVHGIQGLDEVICDKKKEVVEKKGRFKRL